MLHQIDIEVLCLIINRHSKPKEFADPLNYKTFTLEYIQAAFADALAYKGYSKENIKAMKRLRTKVKKNWDLKIGS